MRLLDGAFLAMIVVLAYAVLRVARQQSLISKRFERADKAGMGSLTGLFASDQADWRQNAARGQSPGPNTANTASQQAQGGGIRSGPPTARKTPPTDPASPAGGF